MKLSLFSDDMILYIENPKECTKKLLEIVSEYSQIAGYKIKTQKSVVFLYTSSEVAERKIKNTIPFTIATKIVKYLGINLIKEMNYLYTENYKRLLKEIEEDTK